MLSDVNRLRKTNIPAPRTKKIEELRKYMIQFYFNYSSIKA